MKAVFYWLFPKSVLNVHVLFLHILKMDIQISLPENWNNYKGFCFQSILNADILNNGSVF